ncbi:MAG: hypothetical protein IMZ62_17895 [Chloroflexi bacterium]|nr:hypothetical protein [Chloroflexota bacterium]
MMVYDPTNLRRRSIRLKGLDYAAAGGYYVTVVAFRRESFFGEIRNAEMIPNDAGNMINKIWLSLPERFPNIEVDTFQLMPNHFHGILMVHDVEATLVVAPDRAGTRPAPTIVKMIGAFKSITTHEYISWVSMHTVGCLSTKDIGSAIIMSISSVTRPHTNALPIASSPTQPIGAMTKRICTIFHPRKIDFALAYNLPVMILKSVRYLCP